MFLKVIHSGKPSVRLFGRAYPVLLPSIRDPRLHVAAVLLTLQLLGQTVLDFRLSIAQIRRTHLPVRPPILGKGTCPENGVDGDHPRLFVVTN